MRWILPVIISASALAGAQSVADLLPTCSLQCFAEGIAKTSCGVTDYVCQCSASNKEAITEYVTPCLKKSTCSITDLQNVQEFGATFCTKYLASRPTSTSQPVPSQVPPTSTSPAADPAASPTTVTAPSPTESVVDLSNWGANFPQTNWKSVKTKSKSNRGPAVEGVSITLFVIASLVVGFRFYARIRTQQLRQVAQGIGWDEVFALVALAFAGAVLGTVIVGVDNNMGRHQDYQTASELTTLVKSVFYFTIFIAVCFCALKVSILCLYLRMTPKKSHHITIYIVMGVVVAHSIATVICNIFQCNPISDYWNIEKIFSNTMGCVNLIIMDVFNSAWSVFENVVVWMLPIPVVYHLKVPMSRKAALYILIGAAFIAVIASCARLSTLVLWIRSDDISWNYPLLPLLCMVQASVALVTSSLPAIYPLFRKPTAEQISRRRSNMLDLEKEGKRGGDGDGDAKWNSEGSTLNNTAQDRRSRWSFLAWKGDWGHAAKAKQDVEGDVGPSVPAEKSIQDIEELEVESSEGSEREEKPTTQHVMTAYISSSEEAREEEGRGDIVRSTQRMLDADEESLTVPRLYIEDGERSSTEEEWRDVGLAR